jgi:hypothetical protein
MENENIPRSHRRSHRQQRELDAINLFDPTCPVEFITIEALRKAGIALSLTSFVLWRISAPPPILAALGGFSVCLMRKCRSQEALNRAYTHVSSPAGEGGKLTDTLIQKWGLNRRSCAVVEQRHGVFRFDTPGDLFASHPFLKLDAAPTSGLMQKHGWVTATGGTVSALFTATFRRLEKDLTATRPERCKLCGHVHRHWIIHRNSISPLARREIRRSPPHLYVQGWSLWMTNSSSIQG